MKLTLVATLLAALITTCYAQAIDIGSPANGTSVTPGSSLVVEVDRPDSLTGSTEVVLLIAIESCGSEPCPAPGSVLGSILYNGPYDPQFQNSGPPNKPPYQNFTVTIPPALALAPAQLSVFHVALVGLGLEPLVETQAIVLNVV
ncbi:hypothetical protein BYT27DRAFT_7135037 [Phlegmacium glaucopus]|nr:hypothetical protein BYT27DRAFT_7135037 [Phlegmacium glaucopus]